MLRMQQILIISVVTTIITHLVDSQQNQEHKGPQTCGGYLRAPVGTIRTPNFPNPFPIPIKCRWIIEHDIGNGTISVYFTQQYTTSGLTFTEYMYYDDSYKLGERRALTVTEDNVTRIKFLQVQSPVLVVELSLNRLEGTQLRALGLLSVFGFNITYAVNGPNEPPAPSSCSAIECRLLGHCYARHNYQQFFCSCFEGNSGVDCGVGPLCLSTSNMCKNGGTCRQMGPAAVSCICAPGYMGDLCEAQIAPPECGIEECSQGCRKNHNCDCNPRDSDSSLARFDTRLQIEDHSNSDISQEIRKQVMIYLKSCNITMEDEIYVLNVSFPDPEGKRTMWLRLWGKRGEASALRAALARLAGTRLTERLRLLPTTLHFDMQPALNLVALIVNQRQEVWEGSEFILSCMAYGSSEITFMWYKDGVRVNFNGTTRDIWTRTVAKDALGRKMSVLGISEAKSIDSGRWSCSVEDGDRRRCRALRLTILKSPDIRLVPSTLTVNKGDNVTITCLAGAGRIHGDLGFSWAREKTLLPLAPGREVWEDLYPTGSVLKLYNVQRSGDYRCQVSSVAGTNAMTVKMWVLGAGEEECEAEVSHGLRWARTAPGAHASATCPHAYIGEISRLCETKLEEHGVKWMKPDFSNCVAEPLKNIYEQFIRISYGYSWDRVSNIVHQYSAVLPSLPAHPGAGVVPLHHCQNMLQYLLSPAGNAKDKIDSVGHLLLIYNNLLKYPDAFLDEEKIYSLQNTILKTAAMMDNLDKNFNEFAVKTKSMRDGKSVQFNLQPISHASEEWILSSVGVELMDKQGSGLIVLVLYNNLGIRLPSLRRSSHFRSGREMEYHLASKQIQVWSTDETVDDSLYTVTVNFTHVQNYSADASKLACGLRTNMNPRTWNIKTCEVRVTQPSHVECCCQGFGTFALFTVDWYAMSDAENNLKDIVKITMGLGSAMCLVAGILQLLSLATTRKNKLTTALKVLTASTHFVAMLTLLECDTTQEKACPGSLGWLCAWCWCAGSAALCAQPLLLQAELGRAQRAPTVGLLAGVCILAWLTARLFGGAPLQLGAAAQAVCAANYVLLTLLTLTVSFCAALRLRTITHEMPVERRNYLKNRGRVLRQTLVLLLTTSLMQVAGVAYVQPGERCVLYVGFISIAALANGVAMFICYVLCDDNCLQSTRRLGSLFLHRDWPDQHNRETSLSLYIKQNGEMENHGGVAMLESSSSLKSPDVSYWPASRIDGSNKFYKRQSIPDTRADIVRCVEYKNTYVSPQRYNSRNVNTSHAVCDLIPQPHEYEARVCLELGILHTPPYTNEPNNLLTCSVDFESNSDNLENSERKCSICAKSNPDVSKIIVLPIKGCLKKSTAFTYSKSLPSLEVMKEESSSDSEKLNRVSEKNSQLDIPEADKMLNKISLDLDFLLNRTQENSKSIIDQIEEAPT